MIDWNNNGKIDGEDLFLTDVLLEDDKGGGGSNKPKGGGCLSSIALFIAVALFVGYIIP